MDELVTLLLGAPLYRNRADAGRALAAILPGDVTRGSVAIGLARGGVEVAAEISRAFGIPLDVLAVRKVRHPHQPEYALGAVTPGGDGVYLRPDGGLTEEQVIEAIAEARLEADELDRRLHEGHPPAELAGSTVLLVDDGLATGATMIGAVRWARAQGAARVVAAVPVAARQSVDAIAGEADLFYCPHVRDDMLAVGVWYANFEPVSDVDVQRLLDETAAHGGRPKSSGSA